MTLDFETVLTSAVMASVVSAVISGGYSLRTKQREFENEYCRMILQRRMVAYEQLEALIISLKTAVLGEDGKPYHLLFATKEDWHSVYAMLGNVLSQSPWLSHAVFEKSQELNYLIFRLKPQDTDVIEFGKTNYQVIAELRVGLERIIAADMLLLYDVKGFLHSKTKVASEFMALRL
jgi:hypothetical protein